MANPSSDHFRALDYIQGYLNKYPDLALKVFSNNSIKPIQIRIKGFTDSDWGGDIESRKSTSSYAFFISINNRNKFLISQSSKL